MFLGDDLLAWLTLAIGGAMAVGNILALVRPPEQQRNVEDLAAAPKARSLLFAVVGLAAAIWAIATLLSTEESLQDVTLQFDWTALHSADDLGEASHP